jgi:hypothetical protein
MLSTPEWVKTRSRSSRTRFPTLPTTLDGPLTQRQSKRLLIARFSVRIRGGSPNRQTSTPRSRTRVPRQLVTLPGAGEIGQRTLSAQLERRVERDATASTGAACATLHHSLSALVVRTACCHSSNRARFRSR